MTDSYRTSIDQLFISEIELLSQTFKRLRSEGAMSYSYSFNDFLDIVFATNGYDNTHLDTR